MRERQVDHPAAVGAPAGHGLGWMLPNRPGLVEHGGDTIGVEAILRMAPERGVAVAMLTNGGSAGRLIDDLLEPLLGDLASVAPPPPLPSPSAAARAPEPRQYLGRYQTRQTLHEVTLGNDGHLWLTGSARNEALTMAETAGVTAEPQRHELRPVSGDTFVLTDSSGAAIRAVEFLSRDATGRARFLHTGRAAPRVD